MTRNNRIKNNINARRRIFEKRGIIITDAPTQKYYSSKFTIFCDFIKFTLFEISLATWMHGVYSSIYEFIGLFNKFSMIDFFMCLLNFAVSIIYGFYGMKAIQTISNRLIL
jgi:hypothetical protein